MTILITGATGLIGNALARRLAAAGRRLRALVRDEARARSLLPAGVELVSGDITEPAGMPAALEGIDLVYHAAGMPEQWARDPSIFDRVNRQGTANLLEAALESKVRRVIHTSTMDVFAAPRGGTVIEDNLDTKEKPTAYERSKAAADREVERIYARGLDVVHVCPSAVYGPSPVHVGLNSFFIRLLRGEAPILPPGGASVVYVESVVDVLVSAAEHGRSGERYLVSDCHVSNRDLAAEIARQAGLARVPPVAPVFVVSALAHALSPIARIFGFRPLITPGQLAFMLWDARVTAAKAERELGFRPTPLADGVRSTVAFLRSQGLAPAAGRGDGRGDGRASG